MKQDVVDVVGTVVSVIGFGVFAWFLLAVL
jgi:hypothetical protein